MLESKTKTLWKWKDKQFKQKFSLKKRIISGNASLGTMFPTSQCEDFVLISCDAEGSYYHSEFFSIWSISIWLIAGTNWRCTRPQSRSTGRSVRRVLKRQTAGRCILVGSLGPKCFHQSLSWKDLGNMQFRWQLKLYPHSKLILGRSKVGLIFVLV